MLWYKVVGETVSHPGVHIVYTWPKTFSVLVDLLGEFLWWVGRFQAESQQLQVQEVREIPNVLGGWALNASSLTLEGQPSLAIPQEPFRRHACPAL